MRVLCAALALAAAHYGPPPCGSDEMEGQVQPGAFICSPKCTGGQCPTDVPSGVTASPMCALQDQSGGKYCGLICQADGDCGAGKCTNLGPAGICTYSSGALTAANTQKLGVADDVVYASQAVDQLTKGTALGVQNGLLLLLGFTGDVKYVQHQKLEADGKDVLVEVDKLVGFWKKKDKAQFSAAYTALEIKIGASKIDLLRKFNEFIRKFARQYSSIEESCAALKAFIANLAVIKKHQEEDKSASYSHLTPLADVSVEAFDKRNNLDTTGLESMLKPVPLMSQAELAAAPAEKDWVKDGAVNAVKNQGQCGSCWSFCTVANIEGAAVVQAGQTLQSLSEQELVDCSKSDNGCNGGLPLRAYEDLVKGDFGLELESEYPYEMKVGSCRKEKSKEKVFISDGVVISQDGSGENQMAAAIVKYGPLAIAMNANKMQFYSGGVADWGKWQCNPQGLNHGVTLVGYGTEGGKNYWKIRNSWGPEWGEGGYYRIVRDKNSCGVAALVTSAIVPTKQAEIIV